jgi:hypothetical protein
MRVGTLLVVGVVLALVGACNGPSPDEEACIQQQGVCVNKADIGECQAIIGTSGLCNSSYVCCTVKGAPNDAGTGVDSGVDAGKSEAGSKDAATSKDGMSKDAPASDGKGAIDGATDASTDGGSPQG